MYATTDIELSRQRRDEAAQQVENNRLARRLRAARRGLDARAGNAMLGRVFAWPSRKEQTTGC